jgi:hypothetical protein
MKIILKLALAGLMLLPAVKTSAMNYMASSSYPFLEQKIVAGSCIVLCSAGLANEAYKALKHSLTTSDRLIFCPLLDGMFLAAASFYLSYGFFSQKGVPLDAVITFLGGSVLCKGVEWLSN